MTQKSLTAKEYEDLIRRLKLLSTCQTSFLKHFLHGKLQEGQSLIKKFLEVIPEDQLITDDKIRELKVSVEALKLDQLVVDTHSNEMSMYQEMEILRHSLDSDTGSLAKRLQTIEAENTTLRSLLKESATTSADGNNQQKYIETLMKEVSSLKEFIDLKSTTATNNNGSEKEIESLKAKLTENEILGIKEKHTSEIEKYTNEAKLMKEKHLVEIEKKENEMKLLKIKINELTSHHDNEMNIKNTKAIASIAEITTLTTQVKQFTDKNTDLNKENDNLKLQINQLEKDIIQLKSTTEIQISSQASTQQSNASLETEIKQLQLKITSLEADKNQIKLDADNNLMMKTKEIQLMAETKLLELETKMNTDKEATMDAAAQEVEEVEKTKNIEIAALLATKASLESQLLNSNKTTTASLLAVQKQTLLIKKDLININTKTKQDFIDMSSSMKLLISNTMMNKFKDSNEKLKIMTMKFRKEMTERKKLHNLIQELKGNIRVFLRVRPPSSREIDQYGGEESCCITFPEPQKVAVFNTEKNKEKIWEFDEVFNFESTQEQLFSEVSGLVTSVLDGYNVCIFAYGQTGSGKTWTMSGPSDNRGVNTRSLDELFQRSAARAADYKDTISVNVLEVYNEDIRDLLVEGGSNEKLDIRQSDRGNHVPGLTTIQVEDLSNVLDLLTISDKNRFSRTTNMNEHSSRSHMMLSVNVTSENLISGHITRGKLNLVDLAGSERINKSGATGQALKEAQNINKSLSALGDVIAARVAKQGHIPFRNSTLTYLLQDSLSQDSKTLMIVCASPILASAEETFCSLNFASRVRTVELGKASRQSVGSGAPTRESSPFPPGSNLSRSTASMSNPANSGTGGATPKQRSSTSGPGVGLSQNSRDKY